MYKYIFTSLFALFLSLCANAQFTEMYFFPSSSSSANFAGEVQGKDANGFLYSSSISGVFKREDAEDTPWVSISSITNRGKIAVSEKAGSKLFLHNQYEVLRSDNGNNWSAINELTDNNLVNFIQYLDNDALIIAKENKTFISTDGGNSFQEFYSDAVLSIAWDWVNNRYVFTDEDGLYAKNTVNSSIDVLVNSSFHEEATVPFYGYFLTVDMDGVVYATERSAFPYIKMYYPANDSAFTTLYPVGTSMPLHARGLIATKTGRVYCLTWVNGAVLIKDNPETHFSNYIPQVQWESHFLDKAGFLYIGNYKSFYSVRQPVFFKPMRNLQNQGFDYSARHGNVIRTDNNSLLSIDKGGIVYQSNDIGETWDSISNIGNIQNFRTVKFVYKQNDGKLVAGVGTQVYESTDNGLNWSLNSPLSDSYNNGVFLDAKYKADGNYHFYIKQDLILRSDNNGNTTERMSELTITTPNFGLTSSFQCIEVTNQGTVLIGGYINNGYVYRSTNNLDSIDLIEPMGERQQSINDIFQDKNGKIWLAAYKGILYSLDDGLTWAKDMNYPELSCYQFIEDSEGNLIATGENATYILENNNWKRISYGYYGLNKGFYNLYLDLVSDLIFANGTYKTSSKTPEFYTTIADNETNGTLSIDLAFYPNPTKASLFISNKKGEESHFSIFNVMGQRIKTFHIDEQSNYHQIDVSEFSNGIYFIEKEVNGIKTAKQFIKY